MTFMRRFRAHVCLLSLLGMLLAQWSVAAYACTLPERGPGTARVASVDCEEHQGAAPSPLCSRHCAGDQGGSAANAAALLAPPVDDRAVLRLPVAHPDPMPDSVTDALPPGRPPPLIILLQRSLT
jgi:hypothetical protein